MRIINDNPLIYSNLGGRKPDAVLEEWGAGPDVYANACLTYARSVQAFV